MTAAILAISWALMLGALAYRADPRRSQRARARLALTIGTLTLALASATLWAVA